MTPQEYTLEAKKFARYPIKDEPVYLRLKFWEELGELAGVLAKAIGKDEEFDKDAMIEEIGDVLWVYHMMHMPDAKKVWPSASNGRVGPRYWEPFTLVSLMSSLLLEPHSYTLEKLADLAWYCGVDLETCAELNIAKLRRRQERDELMERKPPSARWYLEDEPMDVTFVEDLIGDEAYDDSGPPAVISVEDIERDIIKMVGGFVRNTEPKVHRPADTEE
jgi:hypothetical protein